MQKPQENSKADILPEKALKFSKSRYLPTRVLEHVLKKPLQIAAALALTLALFKFQFYFTQSS